MCTIERYNVVYPDGRRETRERVLNCPRGTRSRPCSNVEIRPFFEDRPATATDRNANDESQHVPTSRGSGSSQPRSEQRYKSKTLFDELAAVFKFWKPLKSKKPQKKKYFVREVRPQEVRQQENTPAVVRPVPRAPTPPPIMPRREQSPNYVGIAPRAERQSYHSEPQKRQTRSRRRHQQPAIVVQESSEERGSPSPPTPARDHHRKSRSLSPRGKHDAERKAARDKEKRLSAERIAKAENDARKRAARVAEYERLEKERKRREQIEYEERKRIESAERARIRQQREEYERAQARRRQELEDIQCLEAAARAHQAFRRQQEQARRRRDEENRHRLEEQERIARARRANIPRQPRHTPAVHHGGETMEDRGERFIREAIRQENLRQFDRQAPAHAGPPRGTYDDGFPRRQRTIEGGRRGGAYERPERRDRRSD